MTGEAVKLGRKFCGQKCQREHRRFPRVYSVVASGSYHPTAEHRSDSKSAHSTGLKTRLIENCFHHGDVRAVCGQARATPALDVPCRRRGTRASWWPQPLIGAVGATVLWRFIWFRYAAYGVARAVGEARRWLVSGWLPHAIGLAAVGGAGLWLGYMQADKFKVWTFVTWPFVATVAVVPTANPKRLTGARESVDIPSDERSLQVDLVRPDRTVPVTGCVGG